MTTRTKRRPAMDERMRARRAAVRRSQARRRRLLLASLLAIALLAAVAVALASSPLFLVEEVRIAGVTADRREMVRDAAAISPTDNLLTIDLAAVQQRVEALPWVRAVDVGRVPPATVELIVDTREPVAVLQLPGATWLIDSEGVVVAGGTREGLAVIDAPQAIVTNVGEPISDRAVRNAVAVHAQLPGPLRSIVDRYDASSERGLRLHVALPGGDEGFWVRFGLAERIGAKARAIGLLLEDARAREDSELLGPGIAELDVRAPDNPVLVPHSPPG